MISRLNVKKGRSALCSQSNAANKQSNGVLYGLLGAGAAGFAYAKQDDIKEKLGMGVPKSRYVVLMN